MGEQSEGVARLLRAAMAARAGERCSPGGARFCACVCVCARTARVRAGGGDGAAAAAALELDEADALSAPSLARGSSDGSAASGAEPLDDAPLSSAAAVAAAAAALVSAEEEEPAAARGAAAAAAREVEWARLGPALRGAPALQMAALTGAVEAVQLQLAQGTPVDALVTAEQAALLPPWWQRVWAPSMVRRAHAHAPYRTRSFVRSFVPSNRARCFAVCCIGFVLCRLRLCSPPTRTGGRWSPLCWGRAPRWTAATRSSTRPRC